MKEKENYAQPLAEVATLDVAFTILQSLSGGASFSGWDEGAGETTQTPFARDF